MQLDVSKYGQVLVGYGKKRTCLSLNKVENIYNLSAYYHANVKKNCHIMVEKSTEEIHQILTDAYLNSDQELLELEDNLLDYYNNVEEIVIIEEEELDIDNVLNLDVFVDTLGDIIEDSIDNLAVEADEIINTM
ncbi:hypothetical protein C1646_753223 [Rhizophagus diaphanus]|nr:hypothetical protein C1646_753223 [Rhizophagus diaphanus] [Rhizophagus sp. MUCL 43196]